MPQELLIDVRSPLEFASGALVSDLTPTVNIEYTSIDQLAAIYAQRGISVAKDDSITLYCRSGRRSDIALRRLRELGFANVRDIGGLEEARRVLDRETVGRQLDDGMEGGKGDGGRSGEKSESEGRDDGKKEVRQKSFGALLDGLKECDG